MEHKTIILIICLFFCIPFSLIHADDDHKERKRERHRDGNHGKPYVKFQANPTYKAQCGACHMAYPPDLLPESSWLKLLSGTGDHFGESVGLDADSEKAIKEYLTTNSADHSPSEQARKIIKSLKNSSPLRITEIPYIRKEHHELHPNTFTQKAVGSFSNCAACHTTAENGNFDDDNVKIPQ
jgi:Dihaem cytochrome c